MAESTAGAAWAALDASGLAEAATAVIDGEGTVLAWTGSAERALGHRAADVVGRPVTALLAEGDGAERTANWREQARTRRPWSGVLFLRRRDGSGLKAVVEAQPLLGEGRADWLVSATDPSGSSAWPPARSAVATTLLARAPVGLSIWDTDLRCVWVNGTAARQDGFLRRRRLGRLMTEVQPGPPGRAITAAMRQVLKTGEPVIEREYPWRVPGESEDRVLSASYFRLDGADGQPIGVCNMATDIEKSLVRQHLLTLGEVGSRIGTTLDVLKTSQELADAAVPLLADYVTVDLADTVPIGGEPLQRLASSKGGIPVFRRAGIASVHEGVPESPWKVGEPVFVPRTSPFTQALLSGETHFEPVLDTSMDTWFGRDPERRARAIETGMHSLIIVPLRARGVVLGEVVFVRTENRTPFSRDDLLLIEELVERAALSLDNARRYTREREAAVALQRNLLPRTLWGGPAVDIAFRYLPADIHEGVGGDWFDVIPLPDARVGLMIGDVVGHGINAAALMGQLRTVMGTLADLDLPPEVLLARLDRRVVQMAGGSDRPEGPAAPVMSCTCAYAVYDPVTMRCTVASAGHPPPAVRRPDGEVSFVTVPPGPPIGLGTMTYESATVELPEDSVIALYTDGLIETRNADIDDGLDRLGAALSWDAPSLEELGSHVTETLAPRRARRAQAASAAGGEFVGGSGRLPRSEDDVALLLARTRLLSQRDAAAQKRA
ncbi:SpoIIE family protein phosphatase [Streptomyces sp. NBC_01497]|uniref:SpoIIE family protein phosphatase n=1 Tax=Streptomyces sp. NBC_01497 TaxID=2903885 RepID=UPI002E360491|nr:SpoIIE family protein phosphatase [Streptomyces sp. NBC_01497]